MDNHEFIKPDGMSDADWFRHLQRMAGMRRQASEGYEQHLARLTPDADHSKALLQAHYKALHAVADSQGDTHHPQKD